MAVRVDRPGVYAMSAADYHQDPTPDPSLSASIAHLLLSCSPRHAWFGHPRLNPEYRREEEERFDIGAAAHAVLLEGEGDSGFVIINAADWRTKDARTQRDAARAAGRIPLLADRWADVQAMATAARLQLARHERPIPFTSGQPEQTLAWQEGLVWCRARLDWLHEGHRDVVDYKSTSGSANPDVWTRGPLFANGYDLQAAFYLHGLRRVFGIDATWRFVVQETFPPYALSVIGLGPDVLVLAEKKRRRAVEMWGECLTSNRWPAYPTRTCYAELPPWKEAEWLTREMREAPAPFQDDGQRDIAEVL